MPRRPVAIKEAKRFIKQRRNWVLPSPKELEQALGVSEGYGHRIYKALEADGTVVRLDGRYYLASDPRVESAGSPEEYHKSPTPTLSSKT